MILAILGAIVLSTIVIASKQVGDDQHLYANFPTRN